jgi:ribosomal protein S12 methylthiotransferase
MAGTGNDPLSVDLQGRRYLLVTLGCFRNEVESDLLRGALNDLGLQETTSVDSSDVVLVMTCGFIREACDEGIDTVLELADIAERAAARPPLVLAGCMSQRYGLDLMREMPEISGLLGTDWSSDLEAALVEVLSGRRFESAPLLPGPVSAQRSHDSSATALHVKVSDGCDRSCRFCTIPSIRGPHRSRHPSEIIAEVKRLCSDRDREVLLLAQDLTSYGSDLDGIEVDLVSLLEMLAGVEGARWIRMLYLQPEGVTDRLIEAVALQPRLCDYFDIPFQHASRDVLRRMGRPGSYEENLDLVSKIRRSLPEAALRTTVMVGYPGETDEDFESLLSFIREARLDWLGAFMFSAEDGTEAALLGDQVPYDEALSRYNTVVRLQERVEEGRSLELIGAEFEVVIDGACELGEYDYVGRSYREAPVVDGSIYLKRQQEAKGLSPGSFVTARMVGHEGLDLVGEIERV